MKKYLSPLMFYIVTIVITAYLLYFKYYWVANTPAQKYNSKLYFNWTVNIIKISIKSLIHILNIANQKISNAFFVQI